MKVYPKSIMVFISTMLLLLANAQAAPVFKVTKNNNTVYIGGTFHILTKQDFPLQSPFYKAYKNADEVYFETDIEGTKSNPVFQQLMLEVMFDQSGKTLDTVLNASTFAKLQTYAHSRNMPIHTLMPLTPIGLMLNITIVEYQNRGFTLAGVDDHFFIKAKADNKTIKWFESLEQQVSFIDSFDNDDPNELINYLLDSMDEMDSMIDALHSSWREGDMHKLEKIGLEEFDDYPQMYKVLIKNRNDLWVQMLEEMFKDSDTELVLVGALHLPGKDGLLTQLEQKGYLIEQLK